MRFWVLKSLSQRLISIFPRSQYWNYLFQNYLTKSLHLNSSKFELKLYECKKHLGSFFSHMPTHSKTSFTVFELGTGWHPIIPVGLYLCGAAKIWAVDRVSLLSLARIREVLRFFIRYAEAGDIIKVLPWVHTDKIIKLRNAMEDKSLSSGPDILEKLNIFAIVCDARHTGLEGSSIDFFVSNTTLEYIPEDILKDFFVEFRRLASPTSLMSHLIITGDHYADIDNSITPFNFLKYSNCFWELFNSSVHYQNRLRISDYRSIHQVNGFKILHEYNDFGSPKELDSIRIARNFRHYSRDDLLVIRSRIVSTYADTYSKKTSYQLSP